MLVIAGIEHQKSCCNLHRTLLLLVCQYAILLILSNCTSFLGFEEMFGILFLAAFYPYQLLIKVIIE